MARNPEQASRKTAVLIALFAVLIIVGFGVAAVVTGRHLSVELFVETIRAWGMWGVIGSILLMVIHTFVPFPAELLACANGMIWGRYWGTLVTWTGAMLGASLAFALARQFGRPLVEALVPKHHTRTIDRWSRHDGWQAIFLARFVPVIAFNLINFAAGLTRLGWWPFLWTTGVGILPLTFVMAVIGEQAGELEASVWIWLMVAGVLLWLTFRFLKHRLYKTS